MGNLVASTDNRFTGATLSAAARNFVAESSSAATRKAYQSDARIFVAWCESRALPALPATPETVADFLASQAHEGVSPSTLNRRMAAIRYAHEAAQLENPTASKLVSATLKGIRRATGGRAGQKQAATIDKIYQLVAQCDASGLQGKRDKAILLLGFAGAFRRSELAALTLADIEEVADGLKVTIRKSKTDQEGEGQTIAIFNGRLNVVGILQDYLTAAGITEGHIFRPVTKGGNARNQAISGKSIAGVVKKYAAAAGLNPDAFSGHSLRSGFITSAAEAGANLFKIMDVSRHKSVQTVRGYVRNAEMFKDHAGSAFL